MTEAGYDSAGTSTYFDLMVPLADISRVCAYDRACPGTRDPRPADVADGLTVMDQAAELHALLEGAGVEPPYVVVGHSFGGFVSRLFATAYPDEVAGLLLIESSHEDEIEPYRDLYGPNSPDADWVDGGDLLDIDATTEVLRTAGHDLGEMPVIVLRAEVYQDDLTEVALAPHPGRPGHDLERRDLRRGPGLRARRDERQPAGVPGGGAGSGRPAATGQRTRRLRGDLPDGVDVDCSPAPGPG